MILKGYTPSGKPLTMSNLQDSETEELRQQLDNWPVPGFDHDQAVQIMAARTKKFTTDIEKNTGFEVTRLGRDHKGELVAWERLQVTDQTAFVLNHFVVPGQREQGYYRALTQLAQYLIFEVWGLSGVLWELPAWSDVVAKETERNGFTVFWENEGKAVIGYTKEHYETHLRAERDYMVEEL